MKYNISYRKLIFLFFFLLSNIAISQSKTKQIIFRKKIEKKETVRKTESKQEVKIDTTVFVENPKELDFLNDYHYFDNKELFDNYIISVFSRKNAILHQFVVPIVIYLDPKIPQNTSKEYKVFVNTFPTIKNLDISFTSNRDEANYLLSVSEKEVSGVSKKFLNELIEEEHKKIVFLNMTYTLFNDNNKNSYAYHLKISQSILEKANTISKLKKAFFLSLGNFNVLSYGAPSGSVMDFETTKIDKLIDEDIQVLKMHYHHIFDYKLDVNNFYKLYYKYRRAKK